jgi:hypothetical protein
MASPLDGEKIEIDRLRHIANQFSGDDGRSARDNMIDSKDRVKVPSKYPQSHLNYLTCDRRKEPGKHQSFLGILT